MIGSQPGGKYEKRMQENRPKSSLRVAACVGMRLISCCSLTPPYAFQSLQGRPESRWPAEGKAEEPLVTFLCICYFPEQKREKERYKIWPRTLSERKMARYSATSISKIGNSWAVLNSAKKTGLKGKVRMRRKKKNERLWVKQNTEAQRQ